MRAIVSILAGILCAWVVIELTLVFTDPTSYGRFINDPVSGLLQLKPGVVYTNAGTCYSNVVHINSSGFYAAEFPAGDKKPNEFRIVLVGSSFAQGESAPLDKTPAALLEQLLNGQKKASYVYEVMPITFAGNGTYLDLLYYLRYGESLKPDLVIDIETDYEVWRNNTSTLYVPQFDSNGKLIMTFLQGTQNSPVASIKNLLRNSKIVMNVYDKYVALKQTGPAAAPDEAASPADSSPTAADWDVEGKLLSAFNTQVLSDHARFMLASWSSEQITQTNTNSLSSHLQTFALASRFSYLNLVPFVAAQEKETGVDAAWPCDPHWSVAGNTYAAEGIAAYLEAHPELITKP